ncbi:MAG: pyruvate kinase [Cyclobacteriaceae bacterium]
MKLKPNKIRQLIQEIDYIRKTAEHDADQHRELIDSVFSTYQRSAENLVHYTSLRKHDLRSLQKKLRNLGMSRLANSEGHVMASLLTTRFILNRLLDEPSSPIKKPKRSIKEGKKRLRNHTKELLGYRSKGRRVRIMVTQPSEAAHNYQMVHDMVKNGMNCARINCAHDGPEAWEKMILNIKKASEALNRKVKITMDLAGPKIRTGAIVPGAKVRKFSADRDETGHLVNPAQIVLVPYLTETSEKSTIPVGEEWLKRLRKGDELTLIDTRDKKRKLRISQTQERQAVASCDETVYIGTGTILHPHRDDLEEIAVGELPPVERSITLKVNDVITIHQEGTPGEPAAEDEVGTLIRPAHISCQLPEVFSTVRPGEAILFDDGKIEGIVEAIHPTQFDVRITRAKENGTRLKAEKGINFPATDMGISGLTEKDKKDLAFIVRHADVVNFSFVNCQEDVEELLTELEKHQAINRLSIILKIETQKAFDNLSEILLTAMRVRYIGVMIARGDLAVETGWDTMGRVQSEILSLCNAAHIPVVWATQVLESLAKKGLPSRSEITDATTSLRAECVMLNKGPYINNAIQLLHRILCDMENFHEKNETMLPQMERLLPQPSAL